MEPSFIDTLLNGIIRTPATLYEIIGLSILAYVLEIWPKFDSRWIPVLTILLGPLTYWFFAGPDSVPKTYPHPSAVLAVNGLVSGMLAVTGHTQIVKRFCIQQKETKNQPQEGQQKEGNEKSR